MIPEHQWIEKMENIAKRDILWFRKFSVWTHQFMSEIILNYVLYIYYYICVLIS